MVINKDNLSYTLLVLLLLIITFFVSLILDFKTKEFFEVIVTLYGAALLLIIYKEVIYNDGKVK